MEGTVRTKFLVFGVMVGILALAPVLAAEQFKAPATVRCLRRLPPPEACLLRMEAERAWIR